MKMLNEVDCNQSFHLGKNSFSYVKVDILWVVWVCAWVEVKDDMIKSSIPKVEAVNSMLHISNVMLFWQLIPAMVKSTCQSLALVQGKSWSAPVECI